MKITKRSFKLQQRKIKFYYMYWAYELLIAKSLEMM